MQFFQSLKRASKAYYNKPARPVITGIGIVSPIGIGKENFWKNLLAKETGLDKISLFDASSFPCNIAAEVKNFHPEDYMSDRQIKYYSRATQFSVAAFQLAKTDAKISYFDPYRTDVIMGAAQMSLQAVEDALRDGDMLTYRDVDRASVLKSSMSIPASAVAFMAKTESYVSTLVAGCSSGINAIGIAAKRIRDNEADCVICGGVDTPISPIIMNGYISAGNLASEKENPKNVLFPFDSRHTKTVLGEGCTVFILEDWNKARARGAFIYGEIIGFSQTTENTNEVFLHEKSAKNWARTIRITLEESNSTVDHINAHGLSDMKIDKIEAKAFTEVFGKKTKKIPVVSIKGAVGGASMAAGSSSQIAAAAMTLSTGIIPPTYNYETPDPDCDLNCSSEPKDKLNIKNILITGRGIGGVNAALLMRRY